jgi:hypothetical protein
MKSARPMMMKDIQCEIERKRSLSAGQNAGLGVGCEAARDKAIVVIHRNRREKSNQIPSEKIWSK